MKLPKSVFLLFVSVIAAGSLVDSIRSLSASAATMEPATVQVAEVALSIYAEEARSRLEALAKNQPNTQFLLSITNLPSPVREKLIQVADAGQPFSSGCVGSDPHRRFVAATRAGQTYDIAIEQGGFVHTWFVLEFVTDKTGKVVGERKIERNGAANRSQNGTFRGKSSVGQ